MNSQPPSFSNLNFQSPEDLYTFLLMFQKGLIDKGLFDVIFPMLFQLSDQQQSNLTLGAKNFKALDKFPEKFNLILQNIKSEHSANDLLKASINVNSPKDGKKPLKEYIEDWAAKLKEAAKAKDVKEEIHDHIVTKNKSDAKKSQSATLLSHLKNQSSSKEQIKEAFKEAPNLNKNEAPKDLPSKESPVEKKVFEQKNQPQGESLRLNQDVLKPSDSKTPLNFGSKEPDLKQSLNKEMPVIKAAAQQSNSVEKPLIKEEVNLNNNIDREENSSGSSFTEKSPTSQLSYSSPPIFPVPIWKQNVIASHLNKEKEKEKHKKVQKKEDTRNDTEDDHELNYFKEEDSQG